MDLLGQRTHCGPNVAAPNPRQPYLGDFTADGLDQLTLCSQSPGFGTPAAPVQPNGLQTVALCPIWRPSAPSASLLFQEVAPGDSDGGDFKADGLDQLTLCSQSPGFGTPAAPVQDYYDVLGFSACPEELFHCLSMEQSGDFTADGLDHLTLCSQSPGFGTQAAPVQGHPKSVLSCRHRWPGRLFSLPNNLALSLRCRRRFQKAPLSRDFTADGLDQLTLCSQSPGFGTPAAPVQVLFKETESGQSTSVSKLTILVPLREQEHLPTHLKIQLMQNTEIGIGADKSGEELSLSHTL
ncbi:hypothetical protein STEG23_021778 [Scotinomys teguina]